MLTFNIMTIGYANLKCSNIENWSHYGTKFLLFSQRLNLPFAIERNGQNLLPTLFTHCSVLKYPPPTPNASCYKLAR